MQISWSPRQVLMPRAVTTAVPVILATICAPRARRVRAATVVIKP